MKFLIHSVWGDGAGLAYEIQKGGDQAFLCNLSKDTKNILKGVVPLVSEAEGLSKSPDVVISDMTGQGEAVDRIRKRGFKVVGGGVFNDKIEHDRDLAFKIAKQCGIEVPPFQSFKGPDTSKAIEFVKNEKKRYVMKPEDDLGCALTYVAKDPEDMIQELEYLGKKKLLKCDFVLQEFVKGIEISNERWYWMGKPIPSLSNTTMEAKKLMAGEKGPATGAEFSVVWGYGDGESRLIDETVKKIDPVMLEQRYCGAIDINAILTEDGKVYFLEFTPRLGYSAIHALAELFPEGVAKFFWNLANGKEITLKEGIGTALTMSMPPYPLAGTKETQKAVNAVFESTRGKRILKVPYRHFWPYDLMEQDGGWVTAGNHGLVCYLSGFGADLKSACDSVYAVADKIQIPDAQYRIDGYDGAAEDMETLGEQGWEMPGGPAVEREETEEDLEPEPAVERKPVVREKGKFYTSFRNQADESYERLLQRKARGND